jgi:hypothetical protein
VYVAFSDNCRLAQSSTQPRAALHSSLTRKLRQTSIVTLPLSLAAPTVFAIQSPLDISTQTLKTAGGKQEAVGRDIKANSASSSFQIPAETPTSNDTLQSASLTTCLETALRALG